MALVKRTRDRRRTKTRRISRPIREAAEPKKSPKDVKKVVEERKKAEEDLIRLKAKMTVEEDFHHYHRRDEDRKGPGKQIGKGPTKERTKAQHLTRQISKDDSKTAAGVRAMESKPPSPEDLAQIRNALQKEYERLQRMEKGEIPGMPKGAVKLSPKDRELLKRRKKHVDRELKRVSGILFMMGKAA